MGLIHHFLIIYLKQQQKNYLPLLKFAFVVKNEIIKYSKLSRKYNEMMKDYVWGLIRESSFHHRRKSKNRNC